jgi:hypothetical protein
VDLSFVEVVAPVAGNLVAEFWATGASSGKVLTAVAAGTSNVTLSKGPYKYKFSDTEADLNWLSWVPSSNADGNGLVIKCMGGSYLAE